MKVFPLLAVFAFCLPCVPVRADSFGAFEGKEWTYYGGFEFPGAEGNLRTSRIDDRDAVVLAFDFTNGGAYVAGRVQVEIPESAQTFSFAAKSDRRLGLTLRVKDAADQIHTFKPVYALVGEWQNFSFVLRDDRAGHFGGPNDGVIHFPIRQVTLGVVKDGEGSPTGEICFSAAVSTP